MFKIGDRVILVRPRESVVEALGCEAVVQGVDSERPGRLNVKWIGPVKTRVHRGMYPDQFDLVGDPRPAELYPDASSYYEAIT